jgi:hypothetical protein
MTKIVSTPTIMISSMFSQCYDSPQMVLSSEGTAMKQREMGAL